MTSSVLRRRGFGPLPVHFLGKAATFALLYALPLLFLGDGDRNGSADRQGARLGLHLVGHRSLLVGGDPLRLPGLQAGEVHRTPGGCRRPRHPPHRPGPAPSRRCRCWPSSPSGRSTPTTSTSPPASAPPGQDPSVRQVPRRTAAIVLLAFGLLVTVAAVQTSRNASVNAASRSSLIDQINLRRESVADQQRQLSRATGRPAGSATLAHPRQHRGPGGAGTGLPGPGPYRLRGDQGLRRPGDGGQRAGERQQPAGP